MSDSYHFSSIGYFCAQKSKKYMLPRQPSASVENLGTIILDPDQNFEQALEGVEGFSWIWVLFCFHESNGWKHKVQPPNSAKKQGVFATRAPYRPNPVGMSCVRLLEVKKRKLFIQHHDILDGTPILDIKPYVVSADSRPDATQGWIPEKTSFQIRIEEPAVTQLCWLKEQGLDLLATVRPTLESQPTPSPHNRIKQLSSGRFELACGTWRLRYNLEERNLVIESVHTGYDAETLAGTTPSRWDDVALHQAYASNVKST
jgi:tRNA-Thr(GGU) m(6)t(6)A37 methyltransferase TsaA